jgi:hypothetical protein
MNFAKFYGSFFSIFCMKYENFLLSEVLCRPSTPFLARLARYSYLYSPIAPIPFSWVVECSCRSDLIMKRGWGKIGGGQGEQLQQLPNYEER